MRQEVMEWIEKLDVFYRKNSVALHKLMTLFVLMIVVAWPVYSSRVFAQVAITENHGAAGVEGFVDAAGDVWTLGVNVDGVGSVEPEDVKVNGFAFNSCVPGVSGFDCLYEFDYVDSHLYPKEYDIKVVTPAGSVEGKLVAEFDPPSITNVVAKQEASNVVVSFDAQDKPAACSGLSRVEIFDDESKSLEKIEEFDEGCSLEDFSISLPTGRTGTSSFIARVVAEDKLGHTSTRFSDPVRFDLTAPQIVADSFVVGSGSNIVQGGRSTIPIRVDVKEDGEFLDATLSSSQASVESAETACQFLTTDTFRCIWSVPATFGNTGTFEFEVTTIDLGGNRRTITLSQDILVDINEPVLERFGGLRSFAGEEFVKGQNATIIAEFSEIGSGMDAGSVIADLSGLNQFLSSRRAANRCENKGDPVSSVTCYWENLDVQRGGDIFILEAKDRVGNKADVLTASSSVILDTIAPSIGDISVKGVRDGSVVDFVQSKDSVQISFSVNDTHGVVAEVEVGTIVNAGPTTVPATCKRLANGSMWDCSAVTQPVKSGPDLNADIEVVVSDAAGNVRKLSTTFELLGVEGDIEEPDFWKVTSVTSSPEGIDAATFNLAPQRLFYTMNLVPSNDNIQMLKADILSCEDDPRMVGKPRMISNAFGSTKPTILLEVFGGSEEFFSNEEASIDSFEPIALNCTIGISTRRGNEVIRVVEQEVVSLEASFFESGDALQLRNLDRKIEKLEKRIDSGFFGVIGKLDEILSWIRLICSVVEILRSLWVLFQAIKGTTLGPIAKTVVGQPAASASCKAMAKSTEGLDGIMNIIQVICAIGSCNPDPLPGSWYKIWQQSVLQVYNVATGTSLVLGEANARKVTSLQDNLIISTLGLCVPGIIKNLNKLRQVDCVYLDCLKNNVPAGVSTIEACRELRDYMECKYIWGEVFQFLPFVRLADYVLGLLRSVLTDPVGLIRFILVRLCVPEATCEAPDIEGACEWGILGIFLIDVANNILGALDSFKVQQEDDYCERVL